MIKFDIEGGENEVFANSHLVHKVRYIVGELKTSEENLKKFLALFPNHKSVVHHQTHKLHIVHLIRN